MPTTPYEVVIEQRSNGLWEAHVNGLAITPGTGHTSNEALAVLKTEFEQWWKINSSSAADGVWTAIFFSLLDRYQSQPQAASGDFYVESNCCTSCGVPQAVAPDLIGWTEEPFVSCYWKKQPETQAELEQAFKIFDGQELGCHRYSGTDPKIQQRIGYGETDRVADRPDLPAMTATWGAPRDPLPSRERSPLTRLLDILLRR